MSGAYLRPRELDQALDALAAGAWQVLAGGTDFYPARVGQPLGEDVLDIGGLRELRGIAECEGGHRIGALTTWSDLLRRPVPAGFEGLRAAAREVGGVQIQNAGTLAGNLCNASPAADGTPNLLALDARVELRCATGRRELPLAEFVTGNRRTARAPGELVTAIIVPRLPEDARGGFYKLGARRYLVISIVMAAVVLVPGAGGKVATARAALGACSAVAQRLPALERALAGQALAPGLGERVDPAHLAALSPIDDVRGSAAYRLDAARTALARALDALAAEMAA